MNGGAMEKARTVSRTIMLFTTRLAPTGDQPVPADQAAVWRELHRRPFAERRLELDGETFEVVQVHRVVEEAGPVIRVEGRCYRNKGTDFPLVGGEEDSDEPLDLPDGEGLRTPTHWVWWDLTRLPVRRIRGAEEGLLAMEVARGGPSHVALEQYLSKLRPELPCRMSIMQLVFAEQWEYLRRKPEVKRLTFRVGMDDPEGQGMGNLFCTDVEHVQEVEVVLRPPRGRLLNIFGKLANLQERAERKQHIGVTLDDGRSWYLDDPRMRLRAERVRCAGSSKSADRMAMWEAINDVVSHARAGIASALGRVWEP